MSSFDQRFYLIGSALEGLLSNPTTDTNNVGANASLAIAQADAVMAQLNPAAPQEAMNVIASRSKRISFDED
jgi:hypothetical protein